MEARSVVTVGFSSFSSATAGPSSTATIACLVSNKSVNFMSSGRSSVIQNAQLNTLLFAEMFNVILPLQNMKWAGIMSNQMLLIYDAYKPEHFKIMQSLHLDTEE